MMSSTTMCVISDVLLRPNSLQRLRQTPALLLGSLLLRALLLLGFGSRSHLLLLRSLSRLICLLLCRRLGSRGRGGVLLLQTLLLFLRPLGCSCLLLQRQMS